VVADLELWLREPMPYILVVYDAQADVAYWLYVEAYFARLQDFNLDRMGRTVTVYIPKANVLDESAIMTICAVQREYAGTDGRGGPP